MKKVMNPFQPVNFKNIDHFLESLSTEEIEITLQLRRLIFECIPFVIEKLAYNVPFYYGKKRICYIWPASVPWGKTIKQGVQLGFCEGYKLTNINDFAQLETRKQVALHTFYTLGELIESLDIVKTLLFEAANIDGAYRKVKRREGHFKN